MLTAFRIIQITVVLLTLPMMALGFMSMFSGGGLTPAFQDIGTRLLVWSIFVPIPALILAEIAYRITKTPVVGVGIAIVPIVMWAGLLIWLQIETGFIGG